MVKVVISGDKHNKDITKEISLIQLQEVNGEAYVYLLVLYDYHIRISSFLILVHKNGYITRYKAD